MSATENDDDGAFDFAIPSVFDFICNRVLLSFISTMLVAQLSKCILMSIRKRRWDFRYLTRSGGMPSSHTAMVSSAAMTIGLIQGFDDPVFGLAMALSLVTAYDAVGVRWAASRHAVALNILLTRHLKNGYTLPASFIDPLKEVLGHKPAEVIVGYIFGTVSAFVLGLLGPSLDISLANKTTEPINSEQIVSWVIISSTGCLTLCVALYFKHQDHLLEKEGAVRLPSDFVIGGDLQRMESASRDGGGPGLFGKDPHGIAPGDGWKLGRSRSDDPLLLHNAEVGSVQLPDGSRESLVEFLRKLRAPSGDKLDPDVQARLLAGEIGSAPEHQYPN